MLNKIKKHPLLSIYVFTFVLYFMACVIGSISDALLLPSPQSLSVEDFELYNLEVVSENTLITTGSDPQMIYVGDNIGSLSYRLMDETHGVVCAYYTKSHADDFSNHMRLFPDFGISNEGRYIFPTGIDKIRLDPGSVSGQNYTFSEITLNPDISFFDYLKPTNRQFAILLIAPVMFYCLISIFLQVRRNG